MKRRIVCLALSVLPAGLIVSSPPTPLFQEIAAQVGLNFRHFTGATGEYFMPEIMGSGAALFDYASSSEYLADNARGNGVRSIVASLPCCPSTLPAGRLDHAPAVR